jgi:iron complex transport system substrate-binding protein
MFRSNIIRLLPILVIVFLSACGVPAASQSTTVSVTENSAGTQSSEAQATTRLIKHAMGETEVPLNPQRVVVLDSGELDSVLALGVKPVGAVTAFADGEFQAYLGDKTEGIQKVGTISEPNLEAIIALQPDLILSSKLRHEEIYNQLAQIAPTVFAERVGVVWKENFRLHAEALGKTAEADRIEAAYRERIAQLQQRLEQPDQISVSVVRFLEGQVRQYQRGSFIGTILTDVGVARPEQQSKTDETWTELNRELIPDVDADVMFVTTFGLADETPLQEFQSDPLWAQLNVVQQDRVYTVSDDHWMLGLGYLAADRVLDDLETHLAQ